MQNSFEGLFFGFPYFKFLKVTVFTNSLLCAYLIDPLRIISFAYTSSFAKKKPVDFDGELKTGDVRYDNMTKITIKVQLF